MLPDHLRVPVGPGAVHVERVGFGDDPVLCLHGLGTCAHVWRHVAAALPLGRVTAFLLDLFGHGESDRAVDAAFGIAAQAEYVDRALTGLRVARATVVGLDLGAAVALRLAATRPDRVRGLVLVGPAAPERVRGDDVELLFRESALHAIDARQLLGAAPLLGPLLQRSVQDPARMPPRLVARYLAPFVGQDGVRHLLALVRAITPADLADLSLPPRLPAVVVRGTFDEWTATADAEAVAGLLGGAPIVRVPEAGRLVPEEAPDALARVVADVAARTRPG
jgi:pimeloyl-ACP methyl ester carboxylesterase